MKVNHSCLTITERVSNNEEVYSFGNCILVATCVVTVNSSGLPFMINYKGFLFFSTFFKVTTRHQVLCPLVELYTSEIQT